MTLSHLSTLLAAATFKLPLRVVGHHRVEMDHDGIDWIEDADGDYVVQADSGVYPPTKPDADLIVALVNAAPQLLAIAHAAQAWHAKTCDDHGGDPRYDPMGAGAELCAALRALQEAG